ncbi:YopX family protein [Elizabethkingia anophelis]|uniref:YopX family protein n=1 Tax=Elizabethkingia anophelis TaxID=1117645 RepID=UPI00075093F7|nr:YopX family protein [Elizabethkingia anophelis]AQW91314.1 hypothetical protein BBD28_11900 [Elizabethkingia anophelis]KUY14180.1 hypothetical protein ATB94_09280 [Elizabethkingia anophelis]
MREIRIWDGKKYHYPEANENETNHHLQIGSNGFFSLWDGEGNFITSSEKGGIIEWSTGLLDKNGNKIFEGDKFAFINGQVRENDEWIDNVEEYFVEYINDSAGFVLTTGFGYDSKNCKKLDCDIIYHSEVIGNIHETNNK